MTEEETKTAKLEGTTVYHKKRQPGDSDQKKNQKQTTTY